MEVKIISRLKFKLRIWFDKKIENTFVTFISKQTLVVISIKLEKKILFGMTNPAFPGRTTTDTMGEVEVGGEAG